MALKPTTLGTEGVSGRKARVRGQNRVRVGSDPVLTPFCPRSDPADTAAVVGLTGVGSGSGRPARVSSPALPGTDGGTGRGRPVVPGLPRRRRPAVSRR